ncbi:MAG: D-alanyl-D-alanine carboxypeptidase, partial [Clostridia bacterium]|nr:D-alanyl-D-alanine carboxypeptidase [Clostridia bacterium]
MFIQKIRKAAAIILVAAMLVASLAMTGSASEIQATPTAGPSADMQLDCKSAILLDAKTGAVLFEQNADEALPPASVTKIMTLLLVMEAIEAGKIKLDDTVVTSAHAASMGGSQIYLKEGEQMSVEDMLKSVVISSANDAACALAEFVSGSEEAFVRQMNERAAELGMKNTTFENTNGLDDTAQNHLTSARDIAIMSRELIKHEKILEYSSIWMDTVRGGTFGLTNTNRLVRYYRGCTGLKTGSTSKAGFCISATAERDGVSLICVIMGAETRDIRNGLATRLLDYGFANYEVYCHEPT